jgi:hypothetical protein
VVKNRTESGLKRRIGGYMPLEVVFTSLVLETEKKLELDRTEPIQNRNCSSSFVGLAITPVPVLNILNSKQNCTKPVQTSIVWFFHVIIYVKGKQETVIHINDNCIAIHLKSMVTCHLFLNNTKTLTTPFPSLPLVVLRCHLLY